MFDEAFWLNLIMKSHNIWQWGIEKSLLVEVLMLKSLYKDKGGDFQL